MSEAMKFDEIVDRDKCADVPSSSSPAPSVVIDKDDDNIQLKGTALLKLLLSTSTAVPASSAAEKMITTTEVTDETLNLKKILYQPDQEKKDDKELEAQGQNVHQANTSDIPLDDDDRRLVIDISDEEKDGVNDQRMKSMPSLSASMEDENINIRRLSRPSFIEMSSFVLAKPLVRLPVVQLQENSLPKSITYNFKSSPTCGFNNCVKIDIPALNQAADVPSTTDNRIVGDISVSTTQQQPTKCSKMTSLDELNVISREIDKQLMKKTNEVLELLKELLSQTTEKHIYFAKMSDASETSQSDLLSIAKKLIKRHKFEPNPNHREFMRIKFLQFPTTSKDLVTYFENLLPSLNKEKFFSMIKFYEIIIKEMLNLNKTKILQYLIDFMVVRKNPQLDLLNYNYQVSSSPNLKMSSSTAATKFQLPDSTQNPSERRPTRLLDTSYNFIIRSDPIYLQAGSSFVTNQRNVITCRMSPLIQTRTFERRPFDNNILKGRRIGRRLLGRFFRSHEDEKIMTEFNQAKFVPNPQSEPGTPLHQLTMMRPSPPIVLESDTPPPSLPSEPPSPPQHRITKAQVTSNVLIKPSRFVKQNDAVETRQLPVLNAKPDEEAIRHSLNRRMAMRSLEMSSEATTDDPLQNGQITIQEIQTLSQNGTEIIPTSILKSTYDNRRKPTENEKEMQVAVNSKFMPRGISHDEQTKPTQPTTSSKTPRRRQSCHERIMIAANESDDKIIENSPIGQNYMEFLDFYENEIRKKKQMEVQQQQHQQQRLPFAQQLHNQPKRVRFSDNDDSSRTRSPRNHHPPPHQFQYQQNNHHQHQNHPMENVRPRMVQFVGPQRSPERSPIKTHQPPINYQYYQHHFERELRERGFDHRVENHNVSNGPLELVSHIPPERYHQHEQQRMHFTNHVAEQKPMQRHVQEKPQRVQQKNVHLGVESQQAAMWEAAYQQLQALHRDTATLTPQQYAEHLKQLDHLKQLQPSAFTAYQRNTRPNDDQRPNFYTNSQDIHQHQPPPPLHTSPSQYQMSPSSSREDSPNCYELIHHQEPSLQRKLKSKAKSSKYVEPNQLTKPFYNPAHSTYYTEPFALIKKPPTIANSPPSEPAAFQPPEGQEQVPRSPVTLKQYQWLIAQGHVQNLAIQNQSQRPIVRPPVPTFIESKVNGSTVHHPIHFQEQPTEFLRNYYANQKNF